MSHLQKRNNTYYYRRRIPTAVKHLSTVKELHRPLSTDLRSAKRLALQYDRLFNMIDLAIKLNQSVDNLINELDIKKVKKQVNVFEMYIQNQDISENRRSKVERHLATIQHLLPTKLDKVSMSTLDSIKQVLSTMPRRNIHKYKVIELSKVVKLKVPTEDRMSTETINDHLKTLN